MRRLIMLRHGPTHAKSMVGWSDLAADLSDTAAISRLEAFLPGEALVISSDLSRARDTATAVQGARQRLPHDENLREMHFGDWELKHFSEVSETHPELSRAFWEKPGDIRPPGGESWNQVSHRVSNAVDRVLAEHPDRDIVAVAHFGVILTQVQRALDIEAEAAFGHRINPLSATEFEISENGWKMVRINHHP